MVLLFEIVTPPEPVTLASWDWLKPTFPPKLSLIPLVTDVVVIDDSGLGATTVGAVP